MKTRVYAVCVSGFWTSADGMRHDVPYGIPSDFKIFASRADAERARESELRRCLGAWVEDGCSGSGDTIYLKPKDGSKGAWMLTIMPLDLISPDCKQCDGFVARDVNGELNLFRTIPIRSYDYDFEEEGGGVQTHWSAHGAVYDGLNLPFDMYPEVTWDTEPLEVNITIQEKTY